MKLFSIINRKDYTFKYKKKFEKIFSSSFKQFPKERYLAHPINQLNQYYALSLSSIDNLCPLCDLIFSHMCTTHGGQLLYLRD